MTSAPEGSVRILILKRTVDASCAAVRIFSDRAGVGWCFLLWLSATLLGGCLQADLHRELRFGVEKAVGILPTWPSPPELPRYEYAGQLLGVENFVISDADKNKLKEDGRTQQALMWLVGLEPDGGDAQRDIQQGLQRPQAGVVDATGRIYVTDMGQLAVVVFDRLAGRLRIWTQAADNLTFLSPTGIALGAKKQILVADAELGRVFRLTEEGEPAGEFGKGVLGRPTGLARDAARGRVYVADTHAHDIKVFDDGGELIKSIGRPGQMPGEFNAPTHLAFAQERLYVTDTLNARIQVFDPGGEFLFTFGRRGTIVGDLVRPKGVTVDGAGHVYVVESLHDHLLIFDAQGRFLLPIGGTGKEVGRFYLPSGVWTDGANRIFVADMFNGRVMIFRFLGGNP
ncbi:MAG: 6-bladed beta-propeller [Magnetococcales bacterium]|nr:6-bladed beta-propeller [Magnetococcales bacterium]